MAAITNSRRGFLFLATTILQGFLFARPKDVRAAKEGARALVGRLEMEALGSLKPRRALSICSDIVGEKAILYRKAGERKTPLCTMNPTGQMVWDLCDGRHSGQEICRSIARRCEVSPARAERDVFRFLAELKQIGAIQ